MNQSSRLDTYGANPTAVWSMRPRTMLAVELTVGVNGDACWLMRAGVYTTAPGVTTGLNVVAGWLIRPRLTYSLIAGAYDVAVWLMRPSTMLAVAETVGANCVAVWLMKSIASAPAVVMVGAKAAAVWLISASAT